MQLPSLACNPSGCGHAVVKQQRCCSRLCWRCLLVGACQEGCATCRVLPGQHEHLTHTACSVRLIEAMLQNSDLVHVCCSWLTWVRRRRQRQRKRAAHPHHCPRSSPQASRCGALCTASRAVVTRLWCEAAAVLGRVELSWEHVEQVESAGAVHFVRHRPGVAVAHVLYCPAVQTLAVLLTVLLLCTSPFLPQSIHLIYFFTAGEDEVKCWQIKKGSKAPQAAGTIHTDFERGFICAEVMT